MAIGLPRANAAGQTVLAFRITFDKRNLLQELVNFDNITNRVAQKN